jgi:hypothetical protein
MLRRSKTFVVAAAAAAVVALLPAGAGAADAAMASCQVKPLVRVLDYRETVLILGVYNAPAGAVDVTLTCGVTRNGYTYARVTDLGTGPAAAVAGQATVPIGSFACHEITVRYLDGHTTYSDTCP